MTGGNSGFSSSGMINAQAPLSVSFLSIGKQVPESLWGAGLIERVPVFLLLSNWMRVS